MEPRHFASLISPDGTQPSRLPAPAKPGNPLSLAPRFQPRPTSVLKAPTRAPTPDLYHGRDAHGHEEDLLLG